jgi:hypothetical protein
MVHHQAVRSRLPTKKLRHFTADITETRWVHSSGPIEHTMTGYLDVIEQDVDAIIHLILKPLEVTLGLTSGPFAMRDSSEILWRNEQGI